MTSELPRILFFNINGSGLGHLSRCLAYARRMQGRARPVFFSTASAIETLRSALDEAVDLGAHRLIWQIQLELANTLAAAGRAGDAAAARQAAVAGHEAVRRQVPRGRYRDAFDASTADLLVE